MTERTVDTCVVIAEVAIDGEKMVSGVLVYSAQEVIDLDAGNIAPPPNIGSRVDTTVFRGMGKRDNQFIMILDLDCVFTADKLRAASVESNGGPAASSPQDKQVRRWGGSSARLPAPPSRVRMAHPQVPPEPQELSDAIASVIRKSRWPGLLADHDVCSFDNGDHRISNFQRQSVDRCKGDGRCHHLTTNIHYDLTIDRATNDVRNLALELVSRADFHGPILF
jgi:hypothetical protein